MVRLGGLVLATGSAVMENLAGGAQGTGREEGRGGRENS